MAKAQAQTTTGRTRIKNGLSVTLYGAGAKGHEGNTPVGAGLEPGLIIAIPTTGQTANVVQIEKPEGTIFGGIDSANGFLALASPILSRRCVRVALTAAQITTLHTVPVALLAAPGAGKAIVVYDCLTEFTYGSVQFTSGGVVSPVYHSATTQLTAGGLPAATVQAAANAYTLLGGNAGANGVALTANAGIDLYATIADFAAGDSTMIVKLYYDVLTLG